MPLGGLHVSKNSIPLNDWSDNPFSRNGRDNRYSEIRWLTVGAKNAVENHNSYTFECKRLEAFEDMLLHKACVSVKLKIFELDNQHNKITPKNGRQIAPANNVLATLFEDVSVRIDGVHAIASSTKGYNYKCFLQTLLSYDSSAKTAQLLSSGWCQDSVADYDASIYANNRGWQERKK